MYAPLSALYCVIVLILELSIDRGVWASRLASVISITMLQAAVGGGVHGAGMLIYVLKPKRQGQTHNGRILFRMRMRLRGGGACFSL